MRRIKPKILQLVFLPLVVLSLILIVTGEWSAAGALWVAVICMTPATWIAFKTSYFSIKLFCATALVTQIITLPLFYIQLDRYAFSAHREFGFEPLNVLPIFSLLGLFLLLLASTIKLNEAWFGIPKELIYSENIKKLYGMRTVVENKNESNHKKYNYIIILLVIISLPIKVWMYEMGIGIVGVSPPLLALKLSGILTYVFGMLVPLMIGYLYIKTKRNSMLLVSLISVYSVIIGVSSASKSVALYALVSIIVFSWLDRRWSIFFLSSLMAGFGVTIAAASRELTHLSDGLTTGASTTLGAIGTILETINQLEWSWEMLLIFAGIAGRIEGFQGLWLASQFNSSSIGGGLALFLNSVSHGLSLLDHDLMHLEYLGYTIPYGFYGVVASLNGWMMMASNSNILMLIPFVLYTSVTLIILEKMLMRAAFKYKIPLPITRSILFFSTIWFYTGPGTREFQVMFIAIILAGYLPRIYLLKKPII